VNIIQKGNLKAILTATHEQLHAQNGEINSNIKFWELHVIEDNTVSVKTKKL
jgi:hypothetical protein